MTPPRLVVLTGGPGAGKTAILELVRHAQLPGTALVHEAAGMLFGGGFPRLADPESRRAAQRAIYRVQCELEVVAAVGQPAALLCDRGTVDGQAYWPPGADTLWDAVGTTHARELARYAAVIHLRTPAGGRGYNHANPLRTETAREAAAIDEAIAALWAAHPHRYEVPASARFLDKAHLALEILGRVLA